jgi:type II secretory ATPase GspE/PulE/Tfp pilus assembly ATPase PilB-like protein
MIFNLRSRSKLKVKALGTVLIVEDNLFMAELMAEKIRKRGYDVINTARGEEAIKKIKEAKPLIVLLDSNLEEDKEKLWTLKTIRKTYDKKSLPVLVLCSQKDEESSENILNRGANTHLIKNEITTEDIITAMTDILNGKESASMEHKKPSEEPKEKKSPKESGKIFSGPLNIPIAVPTTGDKSTIEESKKLKVEIDKLAKRSAAEVSIIDLVDGMIKYAFLARASDIHLEPFEKKLIARLRVDGILSDAFEFQKETQPGIIARIKVLAAMRTDEHQAAQDGRFKMNIHRASSKSSNTDFDVRVSIVPTYYGENSVLRILAEQTKISTLDDLAFVEADKKKIRNAAKEPYGMILATGPTGSGKTTTLYTVLRELNTRGISIITIEDPIEYSIEGVDQIQVNNRTGLTFASGLRSILRQDPNVVMVGEIRDEETASIAVNAALTGHKLLSTLHTNDAATTLPRLLDMGVEPFLVASTVNIALGQRLVRVLCQKCRAKKKMTDAELDALKEIIGAEVLGDKRDFYEAKGCELCNNSGYYDRMGIYEILEVDDFIRDAIIKRADAGEIKKIAVKNGMVTLLEDGLRKAVAGYTSIEEILRVIHE